MRGHGEGRPGSGEAWSTGDVDEYERTRYRNLDQRLVDRLERGALERLVRAAARPGDRVLDMPCGYGRLTEIAAGGSDGAASGGSDGAASGGSDVPAPGAAEISPAGGAEVPPAGGADVAAAPSAAPGRRVVAADRSREMLRSSRGKARGAALHCGADARRLPFRDRSFDGVICVRLIQHLAGAARREVFRELARVTARWAVISVYRKAGLHHLQRRLLGRGRMCVSLDRIRDEVVDAGFRLERVAKPLPLLHAQTLLSLRRR